MLLQFAAAGYVQLLDAAADAEHRHVTLQGAREERELGAVALRVDAECLRMGLVAVDLRVEVGAAGEDERVERVERLLDRFLARRHEQRPPSRALDGPHVVGGNQRSLELPVAPAGGRDVRGDADDGSHSNKSTGTERPVIVDTSALVATGVETVLRVIEPATEAILAELPHAGAE